MNMICEVESAGSDAKAEVRLANELATVPSTDTRTALDGGSVPLEEWEVVAFAVAVGDDGVVEVPVPFVPVAEKLKDGERLYAVMSIHEVLPRKVPRS
jgi:hypothetical protein